MYIFKIVAFYHIHYAMEKILTDGLFYINKFLCNPWFLFYKTFCLHISYNINFSVTQKLLSLVDMAWITSQWWKSIIL
jgi:hypothetical protein